MGNENQDAFDKICGDCTGIDMTTITDDDVRAQAEVWAKSGDPCSDEMIAAAIAGLHEYQN